MLDRLANIVGAILGIGVALVVVSGWLGDQSSIAGSLWFLGAALVILDLPLVVVVGGALLVRRLGRAAGAVPTPSGPTVPQPGWEGWQLTLDGIEHELWIPAEGPDRRVLLDGAWVTTRREAGRRTALEIAGHPAQVVASVDWNTTVRAAPLVLAVGLTGLATYEPLPMRYELLVDGAARPAGERRRFGKDGPIATRGAPVSTSPGTGPSVAGIPIGAASPPGRGIHLDPPGS